MMRFPGSISAMADLKRRISLPLNWPRTISATVLGSPMSILNTAMSARSGAGASIVASEIKHAVSALREPPIGIDMDRASVRWLGSRSLFWARGRRIAGFEDLVDHDQLLRLERHRP